jgi:hypothetical protein
MTVIELSKVQRLGLSQDAIGQAEHLGIRVGATTERDHAGPFRLEQGQEARVVEICGDDDALLGACPLEDFGV